MDMNHDDGMQNLSEPISNDTIDIDFWLQKILATRPGKHHYLLREALVLAHLAGANEATPTGESCLAQGLHMAEILNALHVDDETLAAAILYSSAQYTDLKPEDLTEHLGPNVSKLIQGVRRMVSIGDLYQAIETHKQQKHNIDNIRKMLLAMVDDIRVVLIKIAERLCILRRADIFNYHQKQQVAKETMAIYAPLANRLGIIPIKLEMEDLAFSYLDNEQYQKILQFLKENRDERERHIQEIIEKVESLLRNVGLHDFQITGRAKHIYSIYRKMQRKNVSIEEIYDVRAIRVLVPTVQDCYMVLSAIHSNWQNIPKEFDDYIATPKPNGYRSIHTAVTGPDGKNLEVQIRTYEMHKVAELGVAAHWVYKEGVPQKSDYETKIAWLREVIDWQEEITASEDELNEIRQIFNDRVYVLTPAGDILDLPQGATPLDFAYHVHSELGHRCRGAKINGNIVPLTYQLRTGERVEILTSKRANPSRDWINPNLGFLKTSRAKAKVLHWFKKQNLAQTIAEAKGLLEAELHRLNVKDIDLNAIADQLDYKSSDDLLTSLGYGDIKIGQIINLIQIKLKPPVAEKVEVPMIAVGTHKKIKTGKEAADINIQGIDNLLTNIAQCCKPIPGDAIVGYITQGRGLSIHRKDCYNILQASKLRPEKILSVSWGSRKENRYPIDLIIAAYMRPGLVRDISNVIANENLMMLNLNFTSDKKEHMAYINLTIEIAGLLPLSSLLSKISKIPNVIEVKRHG